MQFEYKIGIDEYVAAQVLYRKLHSRRKRLDAAIAWVLCGVVMIILPYNERPLTWSSSLLALMGVWWIYAGIMSLFPILYFKRSYRRSDLAGRTFKTNVRQDDFEVSGDTCSWRVKWAGVTVKGENQAVFLLYGPTMFIFGKKYLSEQQQGELRAFAGLPDSGR